MGFPTVPEGPAGGQTPPGGQPPGGFPPTGPPPGGGIPPSGGYPPTGPPSGPYQPPPGGGSWFGRNKAWFLPLCAVVVVLAVVGGFLVLNEDDAAADEIFLEPVDFPGEDPFTDGVTTDDGSSAGAAVASAAPPVTGSVNGNDVGLYGGTLDDSMCDREQLVDFLGGDAAKARAFADVLEIDVDEIPSYVAFLTPVLLRGDTRVTNHGFRDGEATPFQAVLQAGTAVLVDAEGVPRVKCNCGNPLAPPTEVSSPDYGGDRWDGFEPDDVQVTFVDVEVDVFVLTDVETGDTFTRPVGTDGEADEDEGGEEPPSTTLPPPSTTAPLGTGDVQVTLQWGGGVDLDLHVFDPSGTEIYYASRTSPSGGQLDQDAQSGCGSSCVENIFWPTGGAPPGQYEAFVVNFTGGPDTPYTLEIRVNGEIVESQSGTVGAEQSPTTTFTVG